MLGSVWSYGYLYEQMVRRELRQKYKGSLLGVLYYLVNPLVLMAAYSVMFTYVLRYDAVPDYPLFLLIGIAVWLFFSQSLMASAVSLLDQAALVRKVRFPRALVPAATVSVHAVIFLVLLTLICPIALALRGTFGPPLLLLPILVVLLTGFVYGLALVVSVLHAYFRDVAPILSAILLPWFFVTPIFFVPTNFPGLAERPWLGELLRWGNPIAPYIEGVRDVIYAGVWPPASVLIYVTLAAAVALVLGRWVFGRMQDELAVVL